ncbi:MAG: efflux RND transporter periplasmic adaptor subunit [Planctomycetales bacterium]|jgi:HlyD family secretion protein|nr:efflux RND transporter periplasmic adaptor subunit [Planctomycetales bacterium]
MFKILLSVIVAATVGVVAAAHHWREEFADRPTFRTVSVARGDLFSGVTATGTVEPIQIVDVGAQIVGSVKSFGADADNSSKTIDYGSTVSEGTVLAKLDDLPHKAELDKSRVSLQMAEAELRLAAAKKKQKERAFERATQLRETDPEAEFEKADAENEVAAAEQAIAEAKLEQAKIATLQAKNNFEYTIIRSPMEGVVIDRRVNIGQTVVAGMNAPSLFLIAKDLRQMLVWSAVNEADIGEIHLNQPVTFTVDAYPSRIFSGTVSQIRLNASLQQNVVTYGVIVNVNNDDGKLLPYMTAKLQFEVSRRTDVMLVPNQSLRWQPALSQISPEFRTGLKVHADSRHPQPKTADVVEDSDHKVKLESPTLWAVCEDGFLRPIPVQVGMSDGISTEVRGGKINPWDRVVTGVIQKAERDFVSSFVLKVTSPKN